jgi:hypothetical protein
MKSSSLTKYLNQTITIYLNSSHPQITTTWPSYQSHWADFSFTNLNQPIVYNPNLIAGTLSTIDEENNIIVILQNKLEYTLDCNDILYVMASEQVK